MTNLSSIPLPWHTFIKMNLIQYSLFCHNSNFGENEMCAYRFLFKVYSAHLHCGVPQLFLSACKFFRKSKDSWYMRMVQSTKFKVRYEINSRLSLTDPIYEVDKSNKILLPLLLWKLKAIGWCHYVEFRTVQKVYQLKFNSFFKVSMGQ